MTKLNLPRGMHDYPPEEKLRRDALIRLLSERFEAYGFSPLETPIVERWEVLSAKYSGGAEILKETFRLTDQGGRALGLRYDLTVPLARFIGSHPTIKRPFKRYQIGPVFRDGPIRKGRTRQFIQCDVDIVGSGSMLADAECINLTLDVFERLGFQVIIKLNNRQILYEIIRQFKRESGLEGAELPVSEDEIILALDKLEKLGRTGVIEELSEKGLTSSSADGLLRVVDGLAGESSQEILTKMDRYQGAAQLGELLNSVHQAQRVQLVPSLARGLSYYTGTIFEVYSVDPPFDAALAGGGRYDRLIGDLLGTKQSYPAVGISFGMEPIMELWKAHSDHALPQTVTELYVIPIGMRGGSPSKGDSTSPHLEITHRLRAAGIKTDLDLIGRGVAGNLRYANAYRIPYALLIGPDELESGLVKLRDMQSGSEELLELPEVIARLRGGPAPGEPPHQTS